MADIFQSLDQLDQDNLQRIIDRLEARGTYPAFVAMREAYLDRLPLFRCKTVLDMGCGTGVVTRALAARLPEGVKLTGTDFSSALIENARRLAAEQGLAERISFEVADSHDTRNRDGAYDLVVLHTLISHVSDPAQVLAEAERLTAPDGHIVVFDGDFASLTFGAGDARLNEQVLQAILNTIVAHPRIMRAFPELVAGTDLKLVDFLPSVLAEAGTASFFMGTLDSYTGATVAAGNLEAQTARDWEQMQRQASEDGTFYGACNFVTYILRKEAEAS